MGKQRPLFEQLGKCERRLGTDHVSVLSFPRVRAELGFCRRAMLFEGGMRGKASATKCSRLGKLEGCVEVTVLFLQFSVGLKYLKMESQGKYANEYWEGR